MNIEAVSSVKTRVRFSAKALIAPILGLTAFALARCTLLGGLYPFGAAMLCILYKERKVFLWCLAGLALGGITLMPTWYGAGLYLLPYVALVPMLKFLEIRVLDKLWWRQLAILLSFAISALCLPLAAYDLLIFGFTAGTAAALCPVFQKVYALSKNITARRVLQRDELLAVNLLLCILLASLPMNGLWVLKPVALFGCLYISFGAKAFGAGGGAGCGAALGLLWLLRGGDSTTALAFVCGGLLGGILKDWWRLGVPVGFLLGDMIVTLYFTRQPGFSLGIFNLLIGLAPVVFLPKKVIERLHTLLGSLSGVSERTGVYLERLHMRQSQRLLEASGMFSELGRVFYENAGADKKSMRVALVGLTAREVCDRCDQYDYCWNSRYSDTYTEMRTAAEQVLQSGKITEMPISLRARCAHPADLAVKMNMLHEKLEMNKAEPAERGLSMAAQCKSVSQMLFQLSKSLEQLPEFDHSLEQQLLNELERKGVPIQDVICEKERGERMRISLKMTSCSGARDCRRRLENLLSELTGTRFACISNACASSKESCSSVFASLPRLSVSAGGVREKKNGEKVCGDSYSLLQLHDGRYIAAISDGAGSGETAARESEGALDLLETLCSASMGAREMFSTMNQLLLLRSRGDGYSTLDMVEIDLEEGVAEWTKIGAVPGYLLRNKRAERIDAGALPMGILNNIQPAVVKKLLREGDILVLVSDGIYDSLFQGGEDGILGYLNSQKEENPQAIAENLLKRAATACGGKARDDMTALAVRVFAE